MTIRRRTTRQKTIIEQVLQEADAHVSADVVYERARRMLPAVSLGTVYRNLRRMVADRRVDVIPGPRGRSLYALNTGDHHHVRCLSCGAVADVNLSRDVCEAIMRRAGDESGFVVKVVEVDVVGYCPACQGSLFEKFTASS